MEMLPPNVKVNVFFDQLKSTSKANLCQKDMPIAKDDDNNNNDNMEDDKDTG